MDIFIVGLIFIMAVTFFVLGYLVKDYLFSFVSAGLLLFLGLSLMISGLDLNTGSIENVNTTISDNSTTGQIIHTNLYEDKDSLITRAIGTILLAVSLYMFVVNYDIYKKNNGEQGLLD